MRQAIQTKFLGPTNHRGARIKATAQAGSVTIAWDYAANTEDNHHYAALALRGKFNRQVNDRHSSESQHGGWPWDRVVIFVACCVVFACCAFKAAESDRAAGATATMEQPVNTYLQDPGRALRETHAARIKADCRGKPLAVQACSDRVRTSR